MIFLTFWIFIKRWILGFWGNAGFFGFWDFRDFGEFMEILRFYHFFSVLGEFPNHTLQGGGLPEPHPVLSHSGMECDKTECNLCWAIRGR